jgi:hypothetical protein
MSQTPTIKRSAFRETKHRPVRRAAGVRCALILMAAVLLASAQSAAARSQPSAHCLFSSGTARCVGTIAGYNTNPAPRPATFRLTRRHAYIVLHVAPFISIFSRERIIAGRLACTPGAGVTFCSGTVHSSTSAIAINTISHAGQSVVLIDLSDAGR